jgi:hypothetical protein
LNNGLRKWVEDYKGMRSVNIKGAKQLKKKIDKIIQDKGLDSDEVYGQK